MAVVHAVRIGPRRIELRDYDPNPHGGLDVSVDYALAEFLARPDLHELVRTQYDAPLDAVLAKVRSYVERVAAIDAALAALPIDGALASYARDPEAQSGSANSRDGRRLDRAFVIGRDFILAAGVRVNASSIGAVTAGGHVFANGVDSLVVVDARGNLVHRCGPPFDGELMSIGDVYCLGEVVFVRQAWLWGEGDAGYLRYERGRGWSSRCPSLPS